jgi:Mn-dependent DtxR family transcriptional regulator
MMSYQITRMSKENNNNDHRSDEFLEKINEMTGEDYKTFYKYEIGNQLRFTTDQIDGAVEDLRTRGLIKKLIGKIRITENGKETANNINYKNFD